MKTPLLAGLLAALALGGTASPLLADVLGQGSHLAAAGADPGMDHQFDRRGRGRGRGGREDRADDDRGGDGHGGRPRIPGGSGCDDPGDLLEHPECRLPG